MEPPAPMMGYPVQYAVSYAALGLVAALGSLYSQTIVARVGLGWLAVALLAVALAYAGIGPRLFMKHPGGRRQVVGRVILWPYDLLVALLFHVYHRVVLRQSPYVEVLPGLYLGRWLWRREAVALGPCHVLDLTCEFDENGPMRSGGRYMCLPVLDNAAPTPGQLREGAAYIRDSLQQGRVYVHCAAGHGRSATLVLAYLLVTGTVAGIDDGVAYLQARRPGVRLNACQRAALREFAARMLANP